MRSIMRRLAFLLLMLLLLSVPVHAYELETIELGASKTPMEQTPFTYERATETEAYGATRTLREVCYQQFEQNQLADVLNRWAIPPLMPTEIPGGFEWTMGYIAASEGATIYAQYYPEIDPKVESQIDTDGAIRRETYTALLPLASDTFGELVLRYENEAGDYIMISAVMRAAHADDIVRIREAKPRTQLANGLAIVPLSGRDDLQYYLVRATDPGALDNPAVSSLWMYAAIGKGVAQQTLADVLGSMAAMETAYDGPVAQSTGAMPDVPPEDDHRTIDLPTDATLPGHLAGLHIPMPPIPQGQTLTSARLRYDSPAFEETITRDEWPLHLILTYQTPAGQTTTVRSIAVSTRHEAIQALREGNGDPAHFADPAALENPFAAGVWLTITTPAGDEPSPVETK